MNENKIDENTVVPLEKKSSIHTLESDLASAVMDKNYGKSIVKIITDPKKNSTFPTNFDNKEEDVNKTNYLTRKNVFIFLIILFVLISVSVILYILYQAQNVEEIKKKKEENVLASTSTSKTNDLVADANKPIINNSDILNPEIIQSADFTKLNRGEIVTEINKIKQILLDKKISANNTVGINTNLDIKQFFEKIKYSGDESLLRSFNNTYAFGLYSTEKNQFENYLLIKIDNFDLAFQSILGWEKYIPIDLKDIFIGNNEILKPTLDNATTSITIEKKYYKNDTKIFIDRLLKNYDIREYVNNTNNADIIYGFINNKFLLITSGESSFLDIKNRLLKENIQR